jgi:segregation and condensation protein B
MNESHIRNVIEAALLAAGKPLQPAELVELFDEGARPQVQDIHAALTALMAEYSNRGIEMKETAAGFRIQVRREMANEISRLWPERPARYSRALLETLALIAYRQPITRAEIEAVRGVAVNPNILKTVIERNWVRVVGHRDVPGRPELLGTTRDFLDYFGLKNLDDLPPLAELKVIGDIKVQFDLPDAGPVALASDADGADGAVDAGRVEGAAADVAVAAEAAGMAAEVAGAAEDVAGTVAEVTAVAPDVAGTAAEVASAVEAADTAADVTVAAEAADTGADVTVAAEAADTGADVTVAAEAADTAADVTVAEEAAGTGADVTVAVEAAGTGADVTVAAEAADTGADVTVAAEVADTAADVGSAAGSADGKGAAAGSTNGVTGTNAIADRMDEGAVGDRANGEAVASEGGNGPGAEGAAAGALATANAHELPTPKAERQSAGDHKKSTATRRGAPDSALHEAEEFAASIDADLAAGDDDGSDDDELSAAGPGSSELVAGPRDIDD